MGAHISKTPLTTQPRPQKHSASLKITKNLSPLAAKIRFICEIPERNLFLALPIPGNILYIFSTTNLKLIWTKKLKENIQIITYSKELKKILVCGEKSFLQIWNPSTFESEAQNEYFQFFRFDCPLSLAYIPISDVIVIRDMTLLQVFDRNLKFIATLPELSFFPPSGTIETFGISKDHLLVGKNTQKDHRLILLNIRKKTIEEIENISFAINSRMEMIQETPNQIFTCITKNTSEDLKSPTLVQFTINAKMNKFLITHRMELMESVDQIWRIQNSQLFVAGKVNPSGGDGWSAAFLLSIQKDKVEVMRCIMKPEEILGGLDNWIMIENRAIVRVNGRLGLDSVGLMVKKANTNEEGKDKDKEFIWRKF